MYRFYLTLFGMFEVNKTLKILKMLKIKKKKHQQEVIAKKTEGTQLSHFASVLNQNETY